MATIEIDDRSGFCFGVVTAIRKAEEELQQSGQLYCLGDIVHNSAEVERLRRLGMTTITHADLDTLSGAKVLLRAHGEPPETYAKAQARGIEIIDATCPVVLRLQRNIRDTFRSAAPCDGPQIVIYGKRGHAEVNGLVGQTDGHAIVIEDPAVIDDCKELDFSRDIALYSQTTMPLEGFRAMIDAIRARLRPGATLHTSDTICRQVANRVEHLRNFAQAHDVVLFVAGTKSSNGKVLFHHCLEVNPRTYLVANELEIEKSWLEGADSIGICGATSTPRWLMEKVSDRVKEMID